MALIPMDTRTTLTYVDGHIRRQEHTVDGELVYDMMLTSPGIDIVWRWRLEHGIVQEGIPFDRHILRDEEMNCASTNSE